MFRLGCSGLDQGILVAEQPKFTQKLDLIDSSEGLKGPRSNNGVVIH